MKKFSKFLALFLALMTAASLTACGGGDSGKESTASTGGSSNAASNTTSDSASEDASTDASSSEPASFKVVTVRWTDAWPVDFLETGIMKEIEEQTNVDITWDVYYNSDWAEQKSLMLAGGDLPDAFWGSICLTDTVVNQNIALFTELTDLIEPNMPNLNRVFETEPSLKAVVTNREGKIYSLPKKLPLRPQVNDAMYINKTWLDNLGLEMPTTYEELADVLVAFSNDDPNGNGQKDEYGYANGQGLSGDLRQLMAPFGTLVSRAGNYMGMIDGEPVFMPVAENYKEAVKWVHELYVNGALHPECFTMDSSMETGLTKDPNGPLTGMVMGWTADAEAGVNAKDFTILPAVAGPDGKRYIEHDPDYLDVSRNELLITTSCSDPARLLQWADAFYTDEASLQTFYGSISDGKIAKNSDGTYDVLVPEDGSSLDTSAWSFSMRDFGPKYMNAEFYDKVKLPADQGDGIKLAEDAVNEEYIAHTFPVCSYTADQTAQMATLTPTLYDYVSSQYAHWVTEGGVDEEWDAYLEQLDAMGLQDYLAIQKDAYKAYTEIVG